MQTQTAPKFVAPSKLLEAQIAELRKKATRLTDERRELQVAFDDQNRKSFLSRGGCDRCWGRGVYVSWDTMDSMSGCYAEFSKCTNPACSADATGPLLHHKHDKYDRNRGVPGVETHPRYRAIFGVYDMQLELLNGKMRQLESRLKRVLAPQKGDRVVVARGRKVPQGVVGKVFWTKPGDYGLRVGIDTGLPDPAQEGKTLVHFLAADNLDVLEG
jgi:hypothetical protein